MKLSKNECKRLKTSYGKWSVITGATSGIGYEITERLAEAGLNIVINSRHRDALLETEQKIKSQYKIEVVVVDADVSEPAGIEKIIQATEHLEVGLLVASAGYGTSGLFIDNPVEVEMNMLRVNCEGLLSITHHFANRFAKQKRGGIILMSSMVAFQGVPYAANYAASKAYVQSFAEALATELKPYNVDVLAAAPGPVDSGFGKRSNMDMGTALSPSQVGVPILKALGRKTTVFPGLLTKVLVYSLMTAPRWVKVRIMAKVMAGFTQHQRR